jgi:SDR family mycofactocin-dependent oxidoreductase
MGRVEGKVAFITGAARGQGRSHAVLLAEEGADVILIDICTQIDGCDYPMATPEDLEETVRLVEKTGRRAIATTADVRQLSQLQEAVAAGVAELGSLDIVCANAGIANYAPTSGAREFADLIDVDLAGVTNTLSATLGHLNDGASLIVTGSVASFMTGAGMGATMGGGAAGYVTAKRLIPQLVKDYARTLAPRRIRVNGVYPTNTNTGMLQNDGLYKLFRPDLDTPTQEEALVTFRMFTPMGIDWVEPVDISNAVLFLASDEARYITGQQLAIDAGTLLTVS